MQKEIKASLLRALKAGGVFEVVKNSRWRQNRLLILCYHSIALDQETLWRPANFISAERLRDRFEILKKGNYRVLSLGEALDRLRSNNLPPRSVVLTFDDGTYDFYKLTYPLLKQYGFPATVYQTTYYCTRPVPVFSLICSYMLWKKRDAILSAAPSLGILQDVLLAAVESREEAVKQMVTFAERERLSVAQKNAVAADLAHQLGIDYLELLRLRVLQLMTPREISELAFAGINFELHTHRHRTPRDQDLFRKEIKDNREAIVAMTGANPFHFCYPSGDYDLMFLPWLEQEGVISSTTCRPGVVSARSRPLLLPRFIDATGQTELQFESWLTGVGALLSAGANAASLKKLSRS